MVVFLKPVLSAVAKNANISKDISTPNSSGALLGTDCEPPVVSMVVILAFVMSRPQIPLYICQTRAVAR